jgi:hypothetical protein
LTRLAKARKVKKTAGDGPEGKIPSPWGCSPLSPTACPAKDCAVEGVLIGYRPPLSLFLTQFRISELTLKFVCRSHRSNQPNLLIYPQITQILPPACYSTLEPRTSHFAPLTLAPRFSGSPFPPPGRRPSGPEGLRAGGRLPVSPCLLVPLSPCLRVSVSAALRFLRSPYPFRLTPHGLIVVRSPVVRSLFGYP